MELDLNMTAIQKVREQDFIVHQEDGDVLAKEKNKECLSSYLHNRELTQGHFSFFIKKKPRTLTS